VQEPAQPRWRERQRDATSEEIKAVARRQMAERGTAALSLRAIAREMGLTAPALYRYYRDRDALITALVVDAFNSLAEAGEAADDAAPDRDDYAARYLEACLAYRTWALAHPTDFMLIFGNPIPDYEAPEDQTKAAALRSYAPFMRIMAEACAAGAWHPPATWGEVPASLQAVMAEHPHFGPPVDQMPPLALSLVLTSWAWGQGLVTLELYGHLQPIIGDPSDFYRFEAEALVRHMGLGKSVMSDVSEPDI
jgi:AcrR family transcriptional regulator